MRSWILLSVLACGLAAPQFSLSGIRSGGISPKTLHLARATSRVTPSYKARIFKISRTRSVETYSPASFYGRPCHSGEVKNYDGTCSIPIIRRNVYAFTAPKPRPPVIIQPEVPNPTIDYNIVFVQSPLAPEPLKPIVLPPPEQKTLVYLLSKRQEFTPQVVEFPNQIPDNPEVFYVNYNPGENPILPGGIDLHTALSQAGSSIGHPGGYHSQPTIYSGGGYIGDLSNSFESSRSILSDDSDVILSDDRDVILSDDSSVGGDVPITISAPLAEINANDILSFHDSNSDFVKRATPLKEIRGFDTNIEGFSPLYQRGAAGPFLNFVNTLQ